MTLIAIVNCRSRQSTWANVIRESWLPSVPKDKADAFFFVGRGEGEKLPDDTIELDCDDSYQGLPDKIRAIMRWSHARDYGHTLKCDDDTILDVPRLLASGYDQYDYTGKANRPVTKDTPFVVPMGFNYWVSKRCAEALLDAPLPENSNDDEKWVAGNLYHRLGVTLHDDQRYRLHYGVSISRPIRMHRPIQQTFNHVFPGEFSWCVFLEGNSGNRIPIEHKLAEFRRVFYSEVVVKK